MTNLTQYTQFHGKTLLPLMALITFAYSASVLAETTECTVISSIPSIITDQGVYCLKGNLATSITTGYAIEIQTNNVTIDFNDFKLGGLAAGLGTTARGVYALNRQNITLRNGNIRGFYWGISLDGINGGGHVIKNNRLDNNTYVGMSIKGKGNVIRGNQVKDTGGTTNTNTAYGIESIGPGAEVIDNKVDGTLSNTLVAYALFLSSADAAIVKHNSFSRTEHSGTGSSYGIYRASGDRVLIQDNAIINSGQEGTTGIRGGSSTESLCRDNSVMNFDTGISACHSSGNLVRP